MRLSLTLVTLCCLLFASGLRGDKSSAVEDVENAENERRHIPRELWAVPPPPRMKTKTASETDANTILGGEPSIGQEFPYFVQADSSASGFVCGGSLVAKDMVLSAAHCLDAWNSVRVLVGPYKHDSTLGPAQWRTIKSNLTVHPDYNVTASNYDYLMFKIEAVTKVNLKPIKLNKSKANPIVNQELTTIGMGIDDSGDYSNRLQKVTILAVSYPSCRAAWVPQNISIDDDTMVCATTTNCRSAWIGDSGGALLDNEETLVGVVSFGATNLFDDCQNNIPNGYARVSGVIGWIEDQICAHSDYVPEDINCPKSLKGMKGMKGMKGTKGTKGVKTPKSVRQRRGR